MYLYFEKDSQKKKKICLKYENVFLNLIAFINFIYTLLYLSEQPLTLPSASKKRGKNRSYSKQDSDDEQDDEQ